MPSTRGDLAEVTDDGQLVTGQQQFSGAVFGEQLIAALGGRRSMSEAPVT